jgi:hypothetical protein
MRSVRFCPWYPLREAPQRAPATANVLQVRVADGLLTYPRGKSAMVHYQHAVDARSVAAELSDQWHDRELWCRHLIEIDDPSPDHLAAYCAKLTAEFVRRFGAAPMSSSVSGTDEAR